VIVSGLDPDVRDAFQRSPLHCAAYGGHINCMNLLLENKANVDLQDQEVWLLYQLFRWYIFNVLHWCSLFIMILNFNY